MNNKFSFILWLLVASTLGAILQVYTTANGIGLSPDSRDYIEAARNLYCSGSLFITNNGKEIPFIHLGPLFPIVLTGLNFLSIDPIIGARWLGTFLAFGNVFVLGLLINLITSGSTRFALLGAFLFTGSLSTLFIHSWAWSEPLFIFLLLSAFYFFFKFNKSGISAHFILSAILFGLALFTRFAGAFFITAVTVVYLTQKLPVLAKLKLIIRFLVLSTLPMSIWSLRNLALYGNITNRNLDFHFITIENLQQFLNSDFFHFSTSWAMLLFVLMILGRLFPSFHWKFNIPGNIAVILASILFYGIGLSLSISLFDANTPLDNRILSPCLVLSFVAGFSYLAHVFKTSSKPNFLNSIIFFIWTLFFLLNLPALIEWSYGAHTAGIFYASTEWRNSPTIQYMNEIPSGVKIYSNAPDAIYGTV